MTDAVTGHYIALTPDRYEFAETTGDEYDDNWLVIRGQASCDGIDWVFEAPALLVTEAATLAEWLMATSQPIGGDVTSGVTFLEPNLALSLVDPDPDADPDPDPMATGHVTIEVLLTHESAPPGGSSASVRLTLDRRDLARSADDWRRELAAFPAR